MLIILIFFTVISYIYLMNSLSLPNKEQIWITIISHTY